MISITIIPFGGDLEGFDVTIDCPPNKKNQIQCKAFSSRRDPGWILLEGVEGMSSNSMMCRFDILFLAGAKTV